MRRLANVACFLALTAVSISAWQTPTAPSSPQQLPVIRAGTTVVPVDVRVVDHSGKPVTDLTQADFTVLEDGVRQQILHFSSHQLVAETPAPGTMLQRAADVNDLSAQNGRTFLLMIGRGYLNPVSKAFEAAIDFVRKDLLPQDQVAVMAWDRATDFTTDHEKVARVLEALKRDDQQIESDLQQYYGGLTALYASNILPKATQARIDNAFGVQGAPATRSVTPASSADTAQMAADQQNSANALMTSSIDQMRVTQAQNAGNGVAGVGGQSLQTTADLVAASLAGSRSFEGYVANARQTSMDVGNLYSGIEYLRFVDGEKHLVFFSDKGLFLPRFENDKSISARASDARVAIDTIQTGGTPAFYFGDFANVGGEFFKNWAIQSLHTMSELTGGQASAYAYADKALTAINQSTSFSYLLGYTPISPVKNGGYREIKVTVNRRNVDVFFRHGYYATDRPAGLSQQQIMAYTRVTTAVGAADDIHDIKLSTKIDDFKEGDARGVAIALHIDPEHVMFTKTSANQYAASLDVAVFCYDSKQEMMIERLWRTVQLTLPRDEYERVMHDGIAVNLRAPVDAVPRMVRVVVYDAAADRLGSTFARER